MRTLAALAAAFLLAACAHVPPPAPAVARTMEWTGLIAEGLPEQQVTVWLPPEYAAQPKRRFPVLYMWDGQNLFDPAKTHYGKAWMVHDVLAAMGPDQAHIVVGIWSPPGLDRYRSYVPQFADRATGPLRADIARMAGGPIAAKRQLDWVTDVLKPRVDATYRTKPDAPDTTIAGASMGGVMSCYAAIERPDVFGRAGCVSAHLALADPEIAPAYKDEIAALWSSYLDAHLRPAHGQRIWMDHGTVGLDGTYGPWQKMLVGQLADRGWVEGRDFTARVYEGAEHDEIFWNRRMGEMLAWLWREE